MTKPSNPLVRDLRRADVFIAVALIGLVLTSQRANAQAAYFYQGNNLTFTSGGIVVTSSSSVTATLLLDSWLAPNQPVVNVSSLPGFRLVMKVGIVTLDTNDQFVVGGGGVSTDAQGMIAAPWGLYLTQVPPPQARLPVNLQ